jgi:NAD(P)-dependent dehydrogenase (short-subunit alcohol dehydrogenase family)
MDLRPLVDDALEITILGSFSGPGYRVRRRMWGWKDPQPGTLAGRTALVTGATSGLGRATTEGFAALGARVILLSRREDELGRLSVALRRRHGEDRFPYVVADMSSMTSVREAVDRVQGSESRLDILVDNAGAIHDARTLTAEAVEMTFATMVVGPFVLLSGLLPLLEASADGRAITVVSGGMYAQRLHLDDLGYQHGRFDGTMAYARAKRAASVMAREWARRLDGRPVRVNAMHPGWADTPGLARSLPRFRALMKPLLRSPQEGVDTVLWLATDEDAGRDGGRLFHDRRARPFDRLPTTRMDPAERRRLWDQVVRLSGAPDPLARSGTPRGVVITASGLREPGPTAWPAQRPEKGQEEHGDAGGDEPAAGEEQQQPGQRHEQGDQPQ